MVRSTIHGMSGSAGPFGLDARGWKRLCSSFERASNDLCESGVAPLTACRLVALDKCPGIRPIGIGETLRRLIGKLILQIARDDLLSMVGSLQLCVGQEAAWESSVLAMRRVF